jgi:hypothetical protein
MKIYQGLWLKTQTRVLLTLQIFSDRGERFYAFAPAAALKVCG